MTSFKETTLTHFLDDLASAAATPGGGCASALAAALAASLVAMVARHADTLDDVAAEADRLRRELEELVDADAVAFDQVMAAFRLPKETEEQKAERSEAIQAGYRSAVEPPLRVCADARRVLELAVVAAERGKPSAASDAGVGALLAASALDGAAMNVQINLVSIKDGEFRASRAATLGELRDGAGELREKALARVRAELG